MGLESRPVDEGESAKRSFYGHKNGVSLVRPIV